MGHGRKGEAHTHSRCLHPIRQNRSTLLAFVCVLASSTSRTTETMLVWS